MAYLRATEEVLNDTYNPIGVVAHTKITVGSTTTVALQANPKRKYAILINDSDAPIYVNLGAEANINEGIRINANGGSFEMSANIGNLYLGAINAVSGTGNMTLLVMEGEE